MNQYFLESPNVKYREDFKNDFHTYTFTGPCRRNCATEISVTVKGPDLLAYHNGKMIQNAFPYLSADEREWLMSGYCSKCFKELFADDQ